MAEYDTPVAGPGGELRTDSWCLADGVFTITTVYALWLASVFLVVFVATMSLVSRVMGAGYMRSLWMGTVTLLLAHGLIIWLLRTFVEDRVAYERHRNILAGAGALLFIAISGVFGTGGLIMVVSGLVNAAFGLVFLYILLRLTRNGVVVYAIMLLVLGVLFSAFLAITKPLLVMQRPTGLSAMFGGGGGIEPVTGSLEMDLLVLFALNAALLGVEFALVLRRGLGEAIPFGAAGGAALAIGCFLLAVPSNAELSMTPLIISSYYPPDDPIFMEGSVSRRDGSPAKHAPTGASILCIHSEAGCTEGEVMCEVDTRCGMCKCVLTNNWGVYKLTLKSPVAAGDYQLKVVVVDERGTKKRITETSDFTVGG